MSRNIAGNITSNIDPGPICLGTRENPLKFGHSRRNPPLQGPRGPHMFTDQECGAAFLVTTWLLIQSGLSRERQEKGCRYVSYSGSSYQLKSKKKNLARIKKIEAIFFSIFIIFIISL